MATNIRGRIFADGYCGSGPRTAGPGLLPAGAPDSAQGEIDREAGPVVVLDCKARSAADAADGS